MPCGAAPVTLDAKASLAMPTQRPCRLCRRGRQIRLLDHRSAVDGAQLPL